MIRYALKCAEAHEFESWFASADAFDTLKASGMVACPVCGTAQVDKALMAPRVAPGRARTSEPEAGPLSAPMSEVEAKLAELRKHVEANSEYVGLRFAAEARKMHEGEAPFRSIYGEAKPEEARKLIEEGVPVAPLPFTPARKTN